MHLYLLSNFHTIPNEHFALNLMFCEGLETFHLRKKEYDEQQMRKYIERIPSHFHDRIIIHSHFNLASEYKLKGAHFTKKYTLEDYKHDQNDSCLECKSFERVGFSFHSLGEVEKDGKLYDYVFLSPIFDSISNKGYNSKFKLNELRQYLQHTVDRPEVVGLGGINTTKVHMAHDMGFDSIALLGYIWTDYETDQNLISLGNKFIGIQKMIEEKNQAKIVSTV